MTLKLGEAVARALEIRPEAHTPADLVALGEQTLMHHAISGEEADVSLLIAAARAAGALDDTPINEADADKVAEQLNAFTQAELSDEIAFYGALETLADLEMPTRARLAEALLSEAGLNPHEPAVNGSTDTRKPMPTAYDMAWVSDRPVEPLAPAQRYFASDRLSDCDLARMWTTAGTTPTADETREILSRLPESLEAEFHKHFDAYKQKASEQVSILIRSRLALHAKKNGIDLSGATISVSKPTLHYYTNEVQTLRGSAFVYGGRTQAEVDSAGYIFSIRSKDQAQRFFLSLTTGKSHPLPSDGTPAEWVDANRGVLFDAEETASTQARNSLFRSRVEIRELGEGDMPTLSDRLSPAIRADIERVREAACGQTHAEKIKDFLLDLVPFRRMVVLIRRGDVPSAILAGGHDILALIPVLAATGRLASLGMKMGKAALLGAAGPLGSPRLIKAVGDAVTRRLASNTGLHSLANLVRPLRDTIKESLTRGASRTWTRFRGLDPESMANNLRTTRSAMAHSLEVTSRNMRGANIADGRWKLRELPASQADDAIGAASSVTAYSTEGDVMSLVRYGHNGAYTLNGGQMAQSTRAVLLAGQDNFLYRTLPVKTLQRYRVSNSDLLQKLQAQRMDAAGTRMVDTRTYARIGDDYVEVVADRAVSTMERPIWRTVPPENVVPDVVVRRLAYDVENQIWRQASVPGLRGGGGAHSRARSRGVAGSDSLAVSEAPSARATSIPRRTFEDIRYDRPNLRLQPFSPAAQEKYPALVGATRREYFVRGPDNQVRRFPGGYSGGTVTPELIDSDAIRAADKIIDYSHAGALDKTLAGYRYDPAKSLATYHAGDLPISSVSPLRGIYPLRPGLAGQYMISANARTDSATACAQMLLAEGKTPAQLATQLERYNEFRRVYRSPEDPVQNAAFQLRAQLKEAPQTIHFNGMPHKDAMAIIKSKLAEDAPIIVFRKEDMVVLDAVTTNAQGTWLTIRHPVTASQVRIRDHKEFWTNDDSALTVHPTRPDFPMENMGIIAIAREHRLQHLGRVTREG